MSEQVIDDTPDLLETTGVLKWFNTKYGFGFLETQEGEDAFLHISALQSMNLGVPGEGAEYGINVFQGPKGLQVHNITKVIDQGEYDFGDLSLDEIQSLPQVTGTIKWFKGKEGYGFVEADDGKKDVFLHKTCLLREGLTEIAQGQRVRVAVKDVDKGREAVTVLLLQDAQQE